MSMPIENFFALFVYLAIYFVRTKPFWKLKALFSALPMKRPSKINIILVYVESVWALQDSRLRVAIVSFASIDDKECCVRAGLRPNAGIAELKTNSWFNVFDITVDLI